MFYIRLHILSKIASERLRKSSISAHVLCDRDREQSGFCKYIMFNMMYIHTCMLSVVWERQISSWWAWWSGAGHLGSPGSSAPPPLIWCSWPGDMWEFNFWINKNESKEVIYNTTASICCKNQSGQKLKRQLGGFSRIYEIISYL